jgi:putative exosortase-associated protein (TIGR04073 family)
MLRLNFAAVLLMVFTLGFLTLAPSTASIASAQGTYDEDVYRDNSDIQKIFNKLGRGVVNVFTGWLEIPKTIAKEWRKTDPFTGTVVGLFKGLGWAVARTLVGFYEVLSFPFPVPRGYEPVMQPEYIMPTVWGERLPLYRDEFIGTNSAVDAAVEYGQPRQSGRTY